MITNDELVGVWVDNNVGGFGIMVLALYPDGRGVLDVHRPPSPWRNDEFQWEVVGDGTQIQISQHLGKPTKPANSHAISLRTEGSQRILRIDHHVPDNEELGIKGGYFARDYVLSSEDIGDYALPNQDSSDRPPV